MFRNTAWKVPKCGVISGPYFPVFGLNTGKYGPEITPHLDTFHAVKGKRTTKTPTFIVFDKAIKYQVRQVPRACMLT